MVNNQLTLKEMKRIYKLGWIISGILLLAGCDISNRDNNWYILSMREKIT